MSLVLGTGGNRRSMSEIHWSSLEGCKITPV